MPSRQLVAAATVHDEGIGLQIPMSEYEKFVFDLKGYIVIPSVLTPAQTAAAREHVEIYSTAPESLPPHLCAPMAGPAEFLIDHPRLLGILTSVIDPNPASLRMESIFVSRRSAGWGRGDNGDGGELWRPHAGANILPSFNYRTANGQIYAGMTRCVWELDEVVHGKGGTCVMPGSHKAGLGTWPEQGDAAFSNGLWETYGCPPGSLVVFSEAVRHTGAEWTHAGNARCAVLMAFNHQSVRFHEPKPCMNSDVIAGLSEQRQAFFKDVWVLGGERRVDPHRPPSSE